MAQCKRKKQSAGALGEMVATRRGIDVVSDMAVVHDQLVLIPDAEIESARDGELEIVIHVHPEVVGGDEVGGWLGLLPAEGAGFKEIDNLPARGVGKRG